MPGVHHNKEQYLLMLKNWQYKTDLELVNILGLPTEGAVKLMRHHMGLNRTRIPIKDPKRIAFICEQFVSGVSIGTIAQLIGKHREHVSTCLTKHWFKKKVSESTTIITLTSSI